MKQKIDFVFDKKVGAPKPAQNFMNAESVLHI